MPRPVKNLKASFLLALLVVLWIGADLFTPLEMVRGFAACIAWGLLLYDMPMPASAVV
jgi:hypothetical protein